MRPCASVDVKLTGAFGFCRAADGLLYDVLSSIFYFMSPVFPRLGISFVIAISLTGGVGCATSTSESGSSLRGVDTGVDGVSDASSDGARDGEPSDSSVAPDALTDVSTESATESGGGGDSGKDGADDVSFAYDAPEHDSSLDPDSACATVVAEAKKLPLDIVFVVDNSASMAQEIHGVELNINEHFANIIEASGIDYRVIMVSRHGSWNDRQICVKSPLSGTDCSPVPAIPVNNPPIFYHYSHEVASHDSWKVLLETYDGTSPDEFGYAPGGWRTWLRPQAAKAFVSLTDDGVKCSYAGTIFDDKDNVSGGKDAATKFDKTLLGLSSDDFGTASHRNYVWYSIVCMAANTPSDKPWQPSEPIQDGKCSTTSCSGPGTGYQALSVLTGGLRFPLCNTASYDAVFQGIAQNVVGSLACQFTMPPLQSDAGLVDPSKVLVQFTPAQGPREKWPNVSDEASCTGKQWYYDDNAAPTKLYLCPDACARAKTDQAAKVEILLGCLGS